MKKILFLLFFYPFITLADNDNPYIMFSTDNNFTRTTTVNWIPVDDVQSTCDKLNKKRTGKPFSYKVLACSEWKRNIIFKNECNVYTSKSVNMWTVGHEIRHCFQGDFHK